MVDFALRGRCQPGSSGPSRSAMAGIGPRKGTTCDRDPMTGEPIETAQVAA